MVCLANVAFLPKIGRFGKLSKHRLKRCLVIQSFETRVQGIPLATIYTLLCCTILTRTITTTVVMQFVMQRLVSTKTQGTYVFLL